MRSTILRVLSAILAMALAGCNTREGKESTHRLEGSGHVVLQPLPEGANATMGRFRQVVYVPIYSSVYLGFDQQMLDLSATLSIRNVSSQHALIVHSARYYDSGGKEIANYVPKPSSLGALATADFVIQRRDRTGGPGANFLVEWSSVEDVDEPVIEAVMIGQHGNAGISFTSLGRPLHKASAGLGVPPK